MAEPDEETGMVLRDQQIDMVRPPAEVLAAATEAAKALKRVVDGKSRKVIINNEPYLEFEDWQTVGRFYGVSPKVSWTKYVEFGEAKGFEAAADVIHMATGRIISSAESMCLDDETNWGNKPLFQLRSMAQTRACSKALRNCLAWVVVLAGYRPTPAEEMEGGLAKEHWCDVHNVAFRKFTKGTSSWWSHKLEDGTYCNETAAKPSSVDETSVKDAVPVTAEQVIEDLKWIIDSGKMTIDSCKTTMAKWGGKGTTIKAMVQSLTPENLAKLAIKAKSLVPSELAQKAVEEEIGKLEPQEIPF